MAVQNQPEVGYFEWFVLIAAMFVTRLVTDNIRGS